MQLGMIGLGRMGANMGRRVLRAGHECVAHDRAADAVRGLVSEGARGAADIVPIMGVTAVDDDVAR